jgi:hypothetical protein
MKNESLDELKRAFEVWRSRKRHVREAVPDKLIERAVRAIGVHGLGPVVRATKIERMRLEKAQRRLERARAVRGKRRKVPAPAAAPSFSRVELSAPTATGWPFAELETPDGLKLRIFTQTEEVLGLLASVCATGGGR